MSSPSLHPTGSKASHKLQNRLALVTGAGTGIGRAVALEFARQGACVVLYYSNSKDGAESAAAEIRSTGGKAAVIRADLSRVDECHRLVDDAAGFLGGLDILMNNAGITEVWDFLFDPADRCGAGS